MEDRKKQERSFELRSEKVRSIVGQIPPSLVRYGITVIGAVLLCLFMIGYFLPYKQVYSGTAVVHGIAGESKTDSMEITLLLRFDGQRMNGGNNLSQPVFCRRRMERYQDNCSNCLLCVIHCRGRKLLAVLMQKKSNR